MQQQQWPAITSISTVDAVTVPVKGIMTSSVTGMIALLFFYIVTLVIGIYAAFRVRTKKKTST